MFMPGGAPASAVSHIIGNSVTGHVIGAARIGVACTLQSAESSLVAGTEIGAVDSSYLKITVMGTLMGHGQ